MKRQFQWIGWMLLTALVLAACSSQQQEVEPPVESKSEIFVSETPNWSDDLDVESLSMAIDQSIRYYKRLPASRTFQFADETYTAEQMIASMELFRQTFSQFQGQERQQKINQLFRFYESVGEKGDALFTGYYEPSIHGSLEPSPKYPTPVYGVPEDLIKVNLGDFQEELKGKRIVGKVKDRNLVPYDDREAIVYKKSLDTRMQPIAWVDNDIELFFLQIQGSGKLRLDDGSFINLNYAAQNGRPYRSVGRYLVDQGILPLDGLSMQKLKSYLYDNPDKVQEVLSHNESYTFFRMVDEGPLGYIEVPLTAKRSIAMDRKLIPRGTLAYVETQEPMFSNGKLRGYIPLKRFALVQDTGGAIVGHGRVDLFWGFGEQAEETAGHFKQRGKVFLVVAKKEFLPLIQ